MSPERASAAPTRRNKPEKLPFRVIKGGLVPADGYAQSRLRARGYGMGDIVFGIITKPRNPKFNRLAHRLGMLVTENIDEFHGLEYHKALKRLQIESGAGCEEVMAFMEIMGQRIKVLQRIPQSLSFENMDEAEFKTTIRQISNYIATEYWPDLTAEQIELMAEAMPEAA